MANVRPHQSFSFMPVQLETFVPDTTVDFDLYIFNPVQCTTILFCSKEQDFTDANRRSLLRNKVQELFISANDYKKYLRYLERFLPSVINSVRIKENEKLDYIFQCAHMIMEDMLEEPEAAGNVKRSARFVKNIINYIGFRQDFFFDFLNRLDKSYSLHAHALNVCVYSLAIVKKLGMQSLRTLQDVGLGSLLHDVGMTMIPEEILNTAGALSPNDRALVEQHPLLGVDMLKGMADCSPVVLDIVTSHHEKLDGSGYPHRITQDNIAQSVRIVTVADIFDALHSYRPYRNALSVFDAFMTMTRDFRGKIDPQVLTNLIRAFHQ